MPGQQATAFSTAENIALRNGYDKAIPEVTVTPALVAGEANQLEVTIRANVPTFFLKVLGFDTMDIQESAIAEFIPPLKLGSPENQFGNNCDPELSSGCGVEPETAAVRLGARVPPRTVARPCTWLSTHRSRLL